MSEASGAPRAVKPIILTIDDEPHVLNAIVRDLSSHFQGEYRIVKAASGAEALEVVAAFRLRDEPIALFLVDQRMPSMTGVEFLGEAIKLCPDAKRVLLTAYADTDAAIASINSLGLDYYLMKPWDPPDERLFPVLDDLLGDWRASVPAPVGGIRVAGTLWSARSHDVKDFLARSQVPYQWLDVAKDAEAMALVEATSDGPPRLPTVFLPDGTTLVDPDIGELAERLGMSTRPTDPFYDLIVIGAGPAGLAAAVYGASEGLRTVVIEQSAAGGQAGTSARIENYLGFPQGVSGADLTRRATAQARRLGAEILTTRQVTRLRVDDPYRIVTLNDGTELSSHSILIATGIRLRELDVPGMEPLVGASVYYGAATSEAVNFRDKKVVVVGGANSAGQGAVFLARFASEVTVLIRGESMRQGMSQYLIDQIEATENISVRARTEVVEVHGADHLESISVKNNLTGETETAPADGMFIFIGAEPHSEIVDGIVTLDAAGFICTGPDLGADGHRPVSWMLDRDPFLLETSVPGIFAAGDVRHGVIRRVASAAGQGAVAVTLVHKYLETV
jgi:thioredoxin reductase (NADPH)